MKRTGLSIAYKICLLLLIFGLIAACTPTPEPEPDPAYVPLTPLPAVETEEIVPVETPLPDDPLDASAETVTLLSTDFLDAYEPGTTLLCAEPVNVRMIAETLLSLTALDAVDARRSGLDHDAIVSLREYLGEISVIETVTVGGTQYDSNVASVALSLQSGQEVSDALPLFTDLTELTLSGTALSPDEIRAIRANHPALALHCDVALNGRTLSSDSEELDLSDVSFSDLSDVISLFPALKVLTLGEALPINVQELETAHEGLAVTYRFRNQTVSGDVTALDLSGGTPSLEELNALFHTAPRLSELTLDDPTEAEIETLVAFNPREKGIVLHCALPLLDEAFPADAEIIDFGSRKVTDEETADIEAMLPLFTNLSEIDLYETRLAQETMDRLFDAHPDIFFGWTFGIWNDFYIVRSDATAFSSEIGLPGSHNGLLTEDDFRNLRYCKGLQALDLGHNGIKNLEFLRNWPHMKILILADTRVTDLSVLAELQELEYLELFLTTPDSYEPLTHLPNLLDLNLCHTKKEGKKYRDDDEILLLTQIKSLERLWISKTLTAEQAQMLRDGLPGVEFDFSSAGSTDKGWRKHPRYFIMREGFKTGTYIPFD